MVLHRKLFCIALMILLSNKNLCLHGAPAEGSVMNKELTGQELIKMGSVMNKPLLLLLGATFVKTEQKVNKELSVKISAAETKLQNGINKLTLDASNEREILKTELCKQTKCGEWSEWSRCSAYAIDTFGARTRSRKCGGNSSICSTKSEEIVETDYQICQGKACKHTLTNNNYCIKLYNSVQKTQKDAQDDCHKDGGHLMNIDSALAEKDIEDFFKKISFSSDVWIDGTRTLPNGELEYEYGSKDKAFSIWSIGEPESTDDCKVFYHTSSKWVWRGRPCTKTYYYLCEIV